MVPRALTITHSTGDTQKDPHLAERARALPLEQLKQRQLQQLHHGPGSDVARDRDIAPPRRSCSGSFWHDAVQTNEEEHPAAY